MRATILAFVVIACVGAVLLGGGITGMFAISQSCCFGPGCPADYLCDAAEQPQASGSQLQLGAVLLGVSVLYLVLQKVHHTHHV